MRPRLRGALAVACAVLALSACAGSGSARAGPTATTTTRTTVPTAPRVLVLGDSNLFESRGDVDAALRDAGFDPTSRGVPGYGLKDLDEYWRVELPALLEPDPEIVVVGLGTNDTSVAADVAAFSERIDEMMEALGDRPVVWITHVDDRPGAPASAGRAINAAIRAAPDRWPNLTVLDFAVDIANDPTILRFDDLHFSERGMRIYAQKITEAVTAQNPD